MFGTRGRTRTGTLLRAGDFESPVSTNFTTLALLLQQGGDYSSDRPLVNNVCSCILLNRLAFWVIFYTLAP